ncbi:MAG: hypothetical protein IPL61_35190 [Myxococcales bacterium]|nr:hypothetical protein [Myxococcales bacterium]
MTPAARVAAIADACARGGFDLHATAAVADYNVRVPDDVRLPDLGRPRALVVVIGNTAALWPRFAAALADDPDLAAAADPLDTYAAQVIGAAVAAATPDVATEVRYAPEPPPRCVAIQRLAEVAGLAALAPSHLAIHPIYGPWFALRAAIVIDVDGPPPRPVPARACDCAQGCQPALDRALAAGAPRDAAELRERWRLWLAVRDACPVGRAWRYGEQQLTYHYTGDRAALPHA